MATSHDNFTKFKVAAIVDRVRDLRNAKSLSQRRLAEKSGVSYMTIAKVECGEQGYSLPSLIKISKALNVTLSELFTDI